MRTASLLVTVLLSTACGSVNEIGDSDAGGDGDGDGDNTDPVISEVTVGSTNPGAPINVRCEASDADGDTLAFSYSTDVGTVTGDSADAVWEAGAERLDATVTCAVDDGQGGTASMDLTTRLQVEAGLLAAYPFSNNADDVVGNADGALVGGGAFVADRFGNANGALSFTGNNSVTLADEPSFDLTAFTVTAWVSVSAANASRPIISKSPNNSPGNYTMSVRDDSAASPGRLQYAHSLAAANFSGGLSLSALPNDQFLHVAVAFDSTELASYVDGAVQNTTASPPTPLLNDAAARIGADTVSLFLGAIDEVRVYNRALTPDEVAAIAAGDF